MYTHKRFLLILLGVLTVGAMAITSFAQQKPSGVLTLAQDQWGEQKMDPAQSSQGGKQYVELVYDYLVGGNREATAISTESGVASKWVQSDDGLTWTFYLRKGIKFHNGDDLTADDVKFSLERLGESYAVAPQAAAIRKWISSITIKDPHQIVLRMKDAASTLPLYLSPQLGTEGAILPKNYIEKNGREYFATNPIGSGPYKVVKNSMGDRIVLEATEKHWYIGIPKYKTISLLVIPELSTRVAMLKTKEVDVINIEPERVDEIKNAGGMIHLKKNEAGCGLYFLNIRTPSPFNDIRVRQAMSLAIDRDALSKEILYGFTSPHQGGAILIGSRELGFTPLNIKFEYNPAKARQLLTESGYKDGFKLTFITYPQGLAIWQPKMAIAIAAYWEKIGIKSEIKNFEYGAIRPMLVKGDFGAAKSPLVGGPHTHGNRPVQGASLRGFYHTNGTFKAWSPQDPELDKKIDAVAGAKNPADYKRLILDVEKHMIDNWYGIPLFETDSIYASGPRGKGWQLGSFDYGLNLKSLVRQ